MKLHRPSRWFYKVFFSLSAVVLILIIIISSAVYGNLINAFLEEVEKAGISSMERVKNEIDTRLREMDMIAYHIFKENTLLKPTTIQQSNYNRYAAFKELKQYIYGNYFISDLALFFTDEQEKIYSPEGTYNIDTFFKVKYKFIDWSSRDFVHTVSTINSSRFIPVSPIIVDRLSESNYAAYLYPFENNFGAVLFLIKEKSLRDMVRNILWNYSGQMCILDSSGQCLAYLAEEDNGIGKKALLERILDTDTAVQVSSSIINNEHYSIIQVVSEQTWWKYVLVMPTGKFLNRVNNSRTAFNRIALIVFSLGILLMFLVSLKNYRPLQKLANSLAIKTGKNLVMNTNKEDELSIISLTIDRIVEENQGLTYQLKSKIGLGREQLLINLLSGHINNKKHIIDLLRSSGMSFQHDYFTVLYIIIDDYKNFTKRNEKPLQDLLKIGIINLIEELSLELGCGYGVNLMDERSIAIILNSNYQHYDDIHIRTLLMKTKNYFRVNFAFTLTIGVGGTYEGFEGIHLSFTEAEKAACFRFIKGENHIIFYQNIHTVLDQKEYFTAEQESELIMKLRQGKEKETAEVIKSVTKKIQEKPPSPDECRFICKSLINTVSKTLLEQDIDIAKIPDAMVRTALYKQFETLQDMEHSMLNLCNGICRFIRQQKESKNFKLRDDITRYIEEHYTENTICLELIADEFGMSPSYITRFFKDQTGHTLMAYIDMLRMKKAKDLLLHTDMNLREIIKETGYYTEVSFIRKFKKNEGVPPIKYREISRCTPFNSQLRKKSS